MVEIYEVSFLQFRELITIVGLYATFFGIVINMYFFHTQNLKVNKRIPNAFLDIWYFSKLIFRNTV